MDVICPPEIAPLDADASCWLDAEERRLRRSIDELRAAGSDGWAEQVEVGEFADALREIDAARDRLAAGRYGICERCGGAIGVARMEAVPATRWCRDCAGTLERGAPLGRASGRPAVAWTGVD